MKIVSPFRPFPPESVEHQALGPFDWIGALRMMAASVQRTNNSKTFAITDVDTDLPVPSYQFKTKERRLMLWMLEVCLRYLESDAFDTNTVMICPDILVCGDISRHFNTDLAVIIRPEYVEVGRPILNSVQWWNVNAKDQLVAFYTRALAIAKTLPPEIITWGADSEPIRQLVAPIEPGRVRRSGLMVEQIPDCGFIEAFSSVGIAHLEAGEPLKWPPFALIDFRYKRKRYMKAAFEQLFGEAVPA